MDFSTIFENPWIVNIGTGIIVALITEFGSKLISNKVNEKEIKKANEEIIKVLKPYVVENNFLSHPLLTSIRWSVAKKFDCKIDELYKEYEICDELIREVLDEPFISSENKDNYIYKLFEIKSISLSDEIEKIEKETKENNEIYVRYRRNRRLISVYLVVLLFILFLLSLYMFFEDFKRSLIIYNIASVSITVFSIIISITFFKRVLESIKFVRNSKIHK